MLPNSIGNLSLTTMIVKLCCDSVPGIKFPCDTNQLHEHTKTEEACILSTVSSHTNHQLSEDLSQTLASTDYKRVAVVFTAEKQCRCRAEMKESYSFVYSLITYKQWIYLLEQ